MSPRIEQMTKRDFQVKPGSLIPELHGMEDAGWMESFWGSPKQPAGEVYRLTKAGRRQLKLETERWERISLAMASAPGHGTGGPAAPAESRPTRRQTIH